MSMNGVDYTKQLAREREYFQDANRKLREATEKRVEDTNTRAEHVMNKQREHHIEDRAELEKHYQKNLSELKDKTQNSISDTNSKANKQLVEERENFTKESLKKSKDFDQRLNDIKSSYQKSFKAEEDRNHTLSASQKSKYDKNISNLKGTQEEQLKEYQDRMLGSGASLKEQYDRERQQLVRSQEDRLTEAYRDSAMKRTDLKNKLDYEMRKTKEAHSAEKEQLSDYTQKKLAHNEKSFNDRLNTMSTDYSQRMDNNVANQQIHDEKTAREHQDKVAEMTRGYNDSLRQIQLEKRRQNNGSGEFAEVAEKQQGLNDKVITENKFKHLNNELVDAQRKYQARAGREQKLHNETLKSQNTEAVALRERQLNEANADKLVTVTKERENADAAIKNREHQNRLDKAAYEAQLMNERNSSNDRLAKFKENFHKSMTALEEKHKASLEDITKSANQDKSEFMKMVQEQRANEIFEMKRSFGKMMDATIENYEQRLAGAERENEYIKLTLGQKLQDVVDQTDKQLASQKKLFDDRRAADIQSQQNLMDQRERQLKKNFTEMNNTYQKKIDKMQVENDTKFKLMTNDYETKLKELRASTSKEMVQKDINHQNELARIKQTYEDEKNRVISAYETQIESIKNGHEEQMRQMAAYKRLS